MNSLIDDNLLASTTRGGTDFVMLPVQGSGPAPTLLLLAMAGADTLTTDPYNRVGILLHLKGWNVVSLDLPCHGADHRAGEGELSGWAARVAEGDDIVADFCSRVNEVVEHLVSNRIADPSRIAAAGTSRGGFMAFQAAVENPLIRAIAAFSPVTDLLVLHEFVGMDDLPLLQRLNLASLSDTLADRAVWVMIGNADHRVSTDKAFEFTRLLTAASDAKNLGCDVTLHVVPAAGHASHSEWHEQAADWFQRTMVSDVRILPAGGSSHAVRLNKTTDNSNENH